MPSRTALRLIPQHHAQILEWIDTITGEISTARIAPADRANVGRFLARLG